MRYYYHYPLTFSISHNNIVNRLSEISRPSMQMRPRLNVYAANWEFLLCNCQMTDIFNDLASLGLLQVLDSTGALTGRQMTKKHIIAVSRQIKRRT